MKVFKYTFDEVDFFGIVGILVVTVMFFTLFWGNI